MDGRGTRSVRAATIAPMIACSAALAACGATGSAHPLGAGSDVGAAATATVSGTFVNAGGPVTPSGASTTTGRNGIIAFYPRLSHGRPVGGPVVTTRSRAADGGRFSAAVPPGTYYVVAANESGTTVFDSVRTTVAAGDAKSVTLELPVP